MPATRSQGRHDFTPGGDGALPYEDPFIGAGEVAESRRAGLCAGRMVYPTN